MRLGLRILQYWMSNILVMIDSVVLGTVVSEGKILLEAMDVHKDV